MNQSIVVGGFEQYSNIIIEGCEFYIRPSLLVGGRAMDLGYSGGLDNFQILNNYCDAYTYFSTYPLTNGTVTGNTFLGYGGSYEQFINDNIWGDRPISGKRSRIIICEEGVRGHLVIYNYDHDNTVVVDVSSLMSAGDNYKLTNVQDYYNDIITGAVEAGNVITISMTGRSCASPIASGLTLTSTFPEFGCFILEKI